MARVGNFNLLDYAREQAFYAETTAVLARARLAEQAERERLVRAMGLWGKDMAFTLPDRLPDLPPPPDPATGTEARVIADRLDLKRARAELGGLAGSLGLTRVTRFVNVLEASYLNSKEQGEARKTGYEISFEIPIFDFGASKVARAEALYMQAVARVAELAVNARSEARQADLAWRTTYDIARHYRDEVVPVRKRISDEMVLRYNGMLAGVFELLTDARDQIGSVMAAIEASRDFWLAAVDREAVMTGPLSLDTPSVGLSARRAAH